MQAENTDLIRTEVERLTSDQERSQRAAAQVCRVILGKEKEVREVMTAILANGHILLEDIFSQFLPAILHMYLSDHHPNDNPPLFHC